MGPRLQALRAGPVTQVPAQPTPIVQALINARDYTPVTADQTPPSGQQSASTAEQPSPGGNNTGVSADQPPFSGQQSPLAAEQSPLAANVTRTSADQSPPKAEQSPPIADQSHPSADVAGVQAEQTPTAADQSPAVADDTVTQAEQSPPFGQQSSLAANNTRVKLERSSPAEEVKPSLQQSVIAGTKRRRTSNSDAESDHFSVAAQDRQLKVESDKESPVMTFRTSSGHSPGPPSTSSKAIKRNTAE
jgi:hypothetical protein